MGRNNSFDAGSVELQEHGVKSIECAIVVLTNSGLICWDQVSVGGLYTAV